MTKTKITCVSCKAQFYATEKAICGICDEPFCPNCSACKCTNISKSGFSQTKVQASLKDINNVKDSQILQISATISPLIGQVPISTSNGTLLKTEFELSDDSQKVPLIIWGPVPEKLFPYRYEYTNITIVGLKRKVFNGKSVLVASKNTKYFINSLKTRTLEYYISELIY